MIFLGIPSLGSFMIPHSLALDRNQQRLFIADRENGRVQVMNSKSGAFVDEIKFPDFGGLVYAVDYRYGERKLFFTPPRCVQLTLDVLDCPEQLWRKKLARHWPRFHL